MGAASTPTKNAYNIVYIFCLRSDLYIIMAIVMTEVASVWHEADVLCRGCNLLLLLHGG